MQNTHTITFTGDTSLGDYYLSKPQQKAALYRLENNPVSFFEGVKQVIEGSDHLIINFESVLAKNPEIVLYDKKYPNYDDPDRTISMLKALGVTAVCLANNHTMDFGPEIMRMTKQTLETAEIESFGGDEDVTLASKPLIILLEGIEKVKRVYVFSGLYASKRYHEEFSFFSQKEKMGVCPLEIQTLQKTISELRIREPEAIIIVCPHWQGFDYKRVSPKIESLCRNIIDSGADYIFAHGTHMVNPIEKYKDGLIAYSLGNFVFNSPGRYNQHKAPPYSLIVRLEITEHGGEWNVEERFYPIISDNKRTGFRCRTIEEIESMELCDTLSKMIYSPFESSFISKNDKRGVYILPVGPPLKNTKVNDDPGSFYETIRSLIWKTPNVYSSEIFSTKTLLAGEFSKRGHEAKVLGKYLTVEIKKKRLYYLESESSHTSLLGWRMLKNKAHARDLFRMAGLSIANGRCYKKDQKEEAEAFGLSLNACVVKPIDGRKGLGITVGVRGKNAFQRAWENASSATSEGILVEEQFCGGVEARYMVVGNKCVAVIQRVPPHVIGNGVDSIEILINKKNEERGKNPHLKNKPIIMNSHRVEEIRKQGFELGSVPPKDMPVLIDWKSGLSSGADSYDITAEAHRNYKEIAECVSHVMDGLDVIGVDILAVDHKKAASNADYIIVEANTRPGIGGHHYPVYGNPINVAGYIVEHGLKMIAKQTSSENP